MASFQFPDVKKERGEIERVAKEYAEGYEEEFVEEFLKRGRKQALSSLDSWLWVKLLNTDSNDIKAGDWDKVKELSEQVSRDWESIKKKMESNVTIDAPIILKDGNEYHLVSGNTRLMIAKALGITPRVMVVDMSDFKGSKFAGKGA